MGVLSDLGSFLPIPGGSFIGGALDSLFGGGKPEDTSTVGYTAFMQSQSDRSAIKWPPVDWLLTQGKASNWPADDLAAIASTYSQNTGTFQKGDWHGAIVSLAPLTVKWFKGAGESFQRAANASYTAFQANGPQPVQDAKQYSAQNAAFGGELKSQTSTAGAPYSQGAGGFPVWGWILAALIPFGFLFMLLFRKRR